MAEKKALPMTFYARDTVRSKIIETVAVYCQLIPGKMKVVRNHKYPLALVSSADPGLQKELHSRIPMDLPKTELLTLNHPRAIVRYLARASNNLALLGKSPVEEGLVDDLIAMALAPVDAAVLKSLDSRALKSTFLGSTSGLRLGDLALYAALHPMAKDLPENLKRWFNTLQNNRRLKNKIPSMPAVPLAMAPSPLFTAGLSELKTAAGSGGAGAGGAKKGGAKAGKEKAAGGKGGKGQDAKKDKAAKKAAKKARLEKEAKARAAKAVGRVDMRVGLVKECKLSEADPTLFVSKVEVSSGGVRQVVSRLGGFVPLEKMQGRKVVVIVNLPEAEFGGTQSQGRILCGTDAKDKNLKSLVAPPADSKIGERIAFDGAEDLKPDETVKDKHLRPVMKKLKVVDGNAFYDALGFRTSAGVCNCPGIKAGTIA
mmetsp:Transcript_3454/g.6888  ORF Transcript_3454/g.6888 Transcript_3454/m.6888 type:complete len:428 (-) Transcript_3454:83-1366(-)|eukprot:CAMPEP_0167822104 /NCGR_PEP_ID=MMETSP0112_2-20121227/7268_1 /TAXON_ID=91324 /ORGANISM="Lotharella globosa, Strain CCCM811" /LENGTH=427 /DNA_ID=CAMNT_0007723349 /DNA_START=66 /DNA_END=1349 /DNA_ORIENTATION=+